MTSLLSPAVSRAPLASALGLLLVSACYCGPPSSVALSLYMDGGDDKVLNHALHVYGSFNLPATPVCPQLEFVSLRFAEETIRPGISYPVPTTTGNDGDDGVFCVSPFDAMVDLSGFGPTDDVPLEITVGLLLETVSLRALMAVRELRFPNLEGTVAPGDVIDVSWWPTTDIIHDAVVLPADDDNWENTPIVDGKFQYQIPASAPAGPFEVHGNPGPLSPGVADCEELTRCTVRLDHEHAIGVVEVAATK